ncbi:hypothetical protein ASPZODRAFT_69398 [Penicilliopsis zonata CBS 506.65]|uniref:GH16 domain-containing protein n=1 Tax=Penicilliopsis zonata CBS 506.65 TaxID=1073090 RepID=A0A1L9SDE7_9EURO|nr:hypothetical protein ASPZODRAFT_69398 [Penicilliopsis zonata CBS 506.65]OJJ45245.1 hypothetical protein ASPZODRAFT_69398 [Penicilliopsis zonata CBS 506.65]
MKLLLLILLATLSAASNVSSCSCGFYDATADLLFTDSTIVYFNETDSVPDDLLVQSFAHRHEHAWNDLYRQGAVESNAVVENSSLSLYCDPSDSNHLVRGASIRTARQDLFFGSFRASMTGPPWWHLGSALAMRLHHNETESWELDILNTDNSSQAWIPMLMRGVFANTWLGVNYSALIPDGIDPWTETEYRVDWTRDRLDYYVGNVLQMSYTKRKNGTIPSTPSALRFEHFSLGNEYTTQGPPTHRSQASLSWTRLFFNSSTATTDALAGCSLADACAMDDLQLRGSSSYTAASLDKWKQDHAPWKMRWIPMIIVIIFLALFVLLTVKTVIRRFSAPETVKTEDPASNEISSSSSIQSLPEYSSRVNTPAPQYQSPAMSRQASFIRKGSDIPPVPDITIAGIAEKTEPTTEREMTEKKTTETVKEMAETKTVKEMAETKTVKALQPQQRIDYLAGFISLSALLVTQNHFCLTFYPGAIETTSTHYRSEYWARMTIATFFLDPLWIGPFLMISTRFLVSNYLRTGNLANMAQKVVIRPFRLLVPVASIFLLEYFLMDSGAITWLQDLPSITWSGWPYTTVVANPGIFIDEVLQLAYLIPNAAPRITYNYCTGVLWTIPVQLQGAWQTLLALIMIRECKTPWKRFAMYAFCIANHWYALSWGSYYYSGLLLADLDMTFKYKKWLYANKLAYYPILNALILLALAGFGCDLASQWTGHQFATLENSWHPDVPTGLSMSQAGTSTYPDYYIPRLNALVSTVAMQAIVELSPAVQKILSAKVLQRLFPHIFTIYLIHGFIFWSVGSWAMVGLWGYGLPYWLCVLLVCCICYAALFACLPLLTPPIEMLGKRSTLRLWEHASSEPVRRRPTLFPFTEQIFTT